jgi:hypothetical protein
VANRQMLLPHIQLGSRRDEYGETSGSCVAQARVRVGLARHVSASLSRSIASPPKASAVVSVHKTSPRCHFVVKTDDRSCLRKLCSDDGCMKILTTIIDLVTSGRTASSPTRTKK